MGAQKRQTKMFFTKAFGITLLALVSANTDCSTKCPTTWYKKLGQEGYFCYKRFLVAKKYEAAKEHCQSMDMQFPKISNNAELELYTDISSYKSWIQAEKRIATPGTLKKWRNWAGKILNKQNWYTNEKKPEKRATVGRRVRLHVSRPCVR